MVLNENGSQGYLSEGHKTISSSGILIDVIDMINNHNLNKGIYKDNVHSEVNEFSLWVDFQPSERTIGFDSLTLRSYVSTGSLNSRPMQPR